MRAEVVIAVLHAERQQNSVLLRAKAEGKVCEHVLGELLNVGCAVILLVIVHRHDIDAAAVPRGYLLCALLQCGGFVRGQKGCKVIDVLRLPAVRAEHRCAQRQQHQKRCSQT